MLRNNNLPDVSQPVAVGKWVFFAPAAGIHDMHMARELGTYNRRLADLWSSLAQLKALSLFVRKSYQVKSATQLNSAHNGREPLSKKHKLSSLLLTDTLSLSLCLSPLPGYGPHFRGYVER